MNRCRHLDLESLIETTFNLIIWSSAWGKPILSLRFVLSFLTVVTQATYASGIMSDSTRGRPTSSKNAETMLGHGQSWSWHPSGHSCWFSAGLNRLVAVGRKDHTHTHTLDVVRKKFQVVSVVSMLSPWFLRLHLWHPKCFDWNSMATSDPSINHSPFILCGDQLYTEFSVMHI